MRSWPLAPTMILMTGLLHASVPEERSGLSTERRLADVPRPAGRTSRHDTVAHRLLDLEAPTGRVAPAMYGLLDDIVDDVRKRAGSANVAKREDAMQALKSVEDVLAQRGFVYPPWGYVEHLSEALTPHRVDAEHLERVARTVENKNRTVRSRADATWYFADCDTYSFIYLAVGEVLGWPLEFMEVPGFGDVGHQYIRWNLGAERIVWEPMSGTTRSYDNGSLVTVAQFNGYTRALVAQTWGVNHRHAEALAEYRKALALGYRSLPVLNKAAWLMATSPQPGVLDGEGAARLADELCTQTTDANYLDTCAAAYARRGDFERARSFQERAVKGLSSDSADVSEFEYRLELYRRNRAYMTLRPEEQKAWETCVAAKRRKPGEIDAECPAPTKRHWR
ncbi:MAG: hypothetical protein AB2A00_35200 [Myxococcota bacterium]